MFRRITDATVVQIHYLRYTKKLTQEEIAVIAKISQGSVSRILSGTQRKAG